jgi:hypothetical protein
MWAPKTEPSLGPNRALLCFSAHSGSKTQSQKRDRVSVHFSLWAPDFVAHRVNIQMFANSEAANRCKPAASPANCRHGVAPANIVGRGYLTGNSGCSLNCVHFFMCVPQAAEHHLAYKHPTTGSATRRVLRVFCSMCLLSSKCTKRVMHKRTHCDRVIGFQCGSWRAEVTQIDSVTVSVWLGHGMRCYILR